MHRRPTRSRGGLRGLLFACLLASAEARAAPPAAADVALDVLATPTLPTLHWIERDPNAPGSVMVEADTQTRTQRGGARCVEAHLVPTGARPTLASPGGWARFSISFVAVRRDDGLQLVGPTLTDDRLGHTVSGHCAVTLTPTGTDTAGAVLATDRGPIFTDRAACQAAAKGGYRYVCDGASCAYAPDAAPVLDLGPCASEAERLTDVLSTLALASESERLASQRRLLRVWRAGGRLFERADDDPHGPCRPLRVAPGEALVADLVLGDERVEDAPFEVARYTLLPTLRVARLGERRGHTGDGGAYGTGGLATTVPLYFGSERVYLGGRWLFFERRICRLR